MIHVITLPAETTREASVRMAGMCTFAEEGELFSTWEFEINQIRVQSFAPENWLDDACFKSCFHDHRGVSFR